MYSCQDCKRLSEALKNRAEISNHPAILIHFLSTYLNNHQISHIIEILIQEFNLLIEGHIDYIYCMALSSDNKYLITGSKDCSIRVWNLETTVQELALIGHKLSVRALTLSNDNKRILSCSEDKTIRIWSLLNKKEIAKLVGHVSEAISISITNREKFIISGGQDWTLRIWNTLSYDQERVLNFYTNRLRCVCMSKDKFSPGSLISYSSEDFIKPWDLEKNKTDDDISKNRTHINIFRPTKDGKYVITNSISGVLLIRVLDDIAGGEGHSERIIAGHSSSVLCLALTSDQKYLVSGSKDKSIKVWSMVDRRPITTLYGHKSAVTQLILTSNNKFLVSNSSDMSIRIWNFCTKTLHSAVHGINHSFAISKSDMFVVIEREKSLLYIYKIS